MKKRPEILDKPVPNSPFIDTIPIPLADWAEVIAYVGKLELSVTQLANRGFQLSKELEARGVVMGEPERLLMLRLEESNVTVKKPSDAPIPAAFLMDKSDREGDPDLN